MWMKPALFLGLLALGLLSSLSALAADRVVLASLEWPPYTGESLPGNGATSEVVREAFRVMGYELEIRFYPWNRALNEARLDKDIAGYFPEYPEHWHKDAFLNSDSVGSSSLGLASRQEMVINWQTLDDLRRYTLGVVAGYANTPEFDAMAKEGRLTIDHSSTDALNLRKVLAGRVRAAVVDTNVFRHLLQVDPVLRKQRGELVMSTRLLGTNSLVVCFSDTERGRRLGRILNLGLRQVDQEAVYLRHFKE
ncbi:MAG: transporter substrate-binding domain-containing protein [Pseudodesulfovibrio sp.]|uniref:Extracellular solute-binding protein family 3 n=1 Tax=Pseudodesulfovibrio aespoeensis (strain ATCC 700646 / DSM 10631 / Aspo-2) TaxID=643562 RepID=E6VT45_PSEA9|nr:MULTISPECIES: transporter substrate-binding domain-containing protein [Pseudodesulfovibrio]MBU4192684.1 transporter substrate-binding domain-containing protein [Pseudomonadota bacterium]ADU62095.1 extracellular solute-binding protein family 3 [Pseudodesulfovibrio aespoeensis Aspo-2]MBU4244194.1 transporter substrate-binding domain-containing protein [Pseudomonadota bacterium]MBU4474738.1 transporter substrate-binding domain-containing protein [Pseudomonadota bacterium]MBU4515935.1 transport